MVLLGHRGRHRTVGLALLQGLLPLGDGPGGAIVVALAVLFALTFLPALPGGPGATHQCRQDPRLRLGPAEGFWHRMAMGVMRRPLLVLFPTLSALLLMGVPFLDLRMAAAECEGPRAVDRGPPGLQDAPRAVPRPGRQPRADRGGVSPRDRSSPPSASAVCGTRSGCTAPIPHVSKVEGLVDQLPVGTRAEAIRLLLDPPAVSSAQLKDLVHNHPRPDRDGLSRPTGRRRDPTRARRGPHSEAERGGSQTVAVGRRANRQRTSTRPHVHPLADAGGSRIRDGLITFLILFCHAGIAVVLPIKAVLMNLVSISGSFGRLVWIFQDGHFLIREPRPLEPSLPVVLFFVIFGLSMDYEVLMLSRIKENYATSSGDNTSCGGDFGLREDRRADHQRRMAIMVGIPSSARFSLASVVLIRAVGVGMALAVALDATLVRVLMVPATMRLFGDLNWWAPKWAQGWATGAAKRSGSKEDPLSCQPLCRSGEAAMANAGSSHSSMIASTDAERPRTAPQHCAPRPLRVCAGGDPCRAGRATAAGPPRAPAGAWTGSMLLACSANSASTVTRLSATSQKPPWPPRSSPGVRPVTAVRTPAAPSSVEERGVTRPHAEAPADARRAYLVDFGRKERSAGGHQAELQLPVKEVASRPPSFETAATRFCLAFSTACSMVPT